MSTVPTFIVGHMSGENWDPSWRGGRDLYARRLDGRTAGLVRRGDGAPLRRPPGGVRLAGLQRDADLRRRDAPREVVAAWAQIIRDAVRAAGGRAAVLARRRRVGHRGQRQHTGFSLADAARLCDFLGPHVYPVGDDQVRQHYAAAWECELAGTFGRPVVLEEFGVSSDFASDANAARYYRQVLHNSLLAGATGWIGWCNSDYDDLAGQDPYRHHAFELHFGLTDSRGRPKPQLSEMKAFAEMLRAVDIGRCERAASRHGLGGVVISRHQLPVYRAVRPRLRLRHAAPGLRVCPAGGPAGRAGQGERRHRRRRHALPRALGQAAARAYLAASWNGWPGGVRRFTSHTRRDRRAGIAALRMAASTQCSVSSISSGPGWWTRSRTTR